MAENNGPARLPRFNSNEERIEFFETHDMGDYWDNLPEAEFEVHIQKRSRMVAIDEELLGKIGQIAETKQVSLEALIDRWLREQVMAAS
jgi:hypothetical protein